MITNRFVDRPKPASPELRQWLAERVDAGDAAAAMLHSMCNTGWNAEVAAQALADALAARHLKAPVEEPDAATPAPLPEPDLTDSPRMLHLPDREVEVLAVMKSPRVVVLGGFLANDECDELRTLAASRLARSTILDDDTGESIMKSDRTSEGMFFQRGENPLCERIEARISAMLRWPVDHGEGMQVLRYGVGAEYKPHNDYFSPNAPGTQANLRRGGQRLGTLLMYLDPPAKGGSTVFSDVGFEVAPVKGNAVFFSYATPDSGSRSTHGGSPVIEGEKWVATKWLRQGRFS